MLEKLFGSEYELKARYVPTLVLVSPLIIVAVFLFDRYSSSLVVGKTVRLMAGAFGGIGIGWPLSVYFLSNMVREAGRLLQEQYFKNGLELPTTRMMMWRDKTISDEHKRYLRKLVLMSFGKILPSKTDEENDPIKSSRVISETVDMIRPSIKDGVRLLQYNIRYGAERNVDGCAPVSFCVAVLAMMVCLYLEGYVFALCEALLATWLGFRWIRASARIEWYGEEYARVFWAEFASRYGESQHS